ncbi:MAG TPA: NrfD/PsrC family molybdoenzyme membrane anchor subunit [Holophagaceae bacterium]|nr:NrfD/PsrC family molybdoenzyme membrane anchor subunit [Holophagaceae bacterium]
MREPVWEFLIVNYLFLGGLSAGLFFVSGLATWLQDKDGHPAHPALARLGAMLAPWPVSLGSALLILDLGKPLRFWKLFLHVRWRSPMSIGSWLLVAFTILSMAYLWSWLEPDTRARLLSKVPRRFYPKLPGFLRAWLEADGTSRRRLMALVGMPMAVGVGIYTGVLLGAVQSRPFWNTNLVAQMFLFSALSSGAATLVILRLLGKDKPELKELRFLYSLDIVLMGLELFIVLPYLIHGNLSTLAVKQALQQIMGGGYTWVFWGLFLGMGLLVPLVIELWEYRPVLFGRGEFHVDRRWALAAGGLVLVGGYTLRYVFVFAGQATGF